MGEYTKEMHEAYRKEQDEKAAWWKCPSRKAGRESCHSLPFLLPLPTTLVELIGLALGVRYVSGLPRRHPSGSWQKAGGSLHVSSPAGISR